MNITTKPGPNGTQIYVDGVLHVPAPALQQAQNEEVFEKFLTAAQLLFNSNAPMDVVARKFMGACQARRGGVPFDAPLALLEIHAAAEAAVAADKAAAVVRRNGAGPIRTPATARAKSPKPAARSKRTRTASRSSR